MLPHSAQQILIPLQAAKLPCLTATSPPNSCRTTVVVPVRNEAECLPALIRSLAQQVDTQERSLDPNSYEVLVLANNCSDGSADIAKSLGAAYPHLRLHVLEVTLPPSQACIGVARRLVMNEAFRRLSSIGAEGRMIASTDGDTVVAPTWVASLLSEFDRGVDAVYGRILTRRRTAGISAATSLYFLRYMAHRYLSAQLEALLDPLPHDCWPRHYQHFGANMAVAAKLYGRVGGIPEVETQEDVALYRRLQQVDAKIRHSPQAQVMTSARRLGRAQGGLAERLNQLGQASRLKQAVWVESPQLTEARILVRHHLRQTWIGQGKTDLACPNGGNSSRETAFNDNVELLAKILGISQGRFKQAMATAPTFGLLVEAIELEQRAAVGCYQHTTIEISLANMHLRQRVQRLRQQWALSPTGPENRGLNLMSLLKSLKQIQPIPLFSLTY